MYQSFLEVYTWEYTNIVLLTYIICLLFLFLFCSGFYTTTQLLYCIILYLMLYYIPGQYYIICENVEMFILIQVEQVKVYFLPLPPQHHRLAFLIKPKVI